MARYPATAGIIKQPGQRFYSPAHVCKLTPICKAEEGNNYPMEKPLTERHDRAGRAVEADEHRAAQNSAKNAMTAKTIIIALAQKPSGPPIPRE